ncbi:TetR/AcrR family transcriptional regulator [Lacisediminihabitans profunda]|uniref:TetR family transcriptional regulator n=1 Tax=Lacisediminihabitans profunda TaxID=2594790 RepID=A0A5C8US99_9MICO|nr:TetR family transcriptional regulator [Lacisediminihabitans profunda]TXN30373.1 TetR family transcriptional regulator [Lacisediminihabitans profunda]
MNDFAEQGIRERKRAATFRTIFEAAAELALELGLEHATVDAISDRANVSSRTFFNYFASKEDAVLGIDSSGIGEEVIELLTGHRTDDVLHDVASLVYSVIAETSAGIDKVDLRKRVLERYPQLLTRQILRVASMEDRLGLVVADWLASTPGFAEDSAEERQEAAQILLSVCLAAMRVAMKKWPRDTSGDPRENYTRAVDLLRTVMERVS